MSGQSSQSGWNSWFGADGEPEQEAGAKPEETPEAASIETPAGESAAEARGEAAGKPESSEVAALSADSPWVPAAAEPEPEEPDARDSRDEPEAQAEPDEVDWERASLAAADTMTAATVLAALSEPVVPATQSTSGPLPPLPTRKPHAAYEPSTAAEAADAPEADAVNAADALDEPDAAPQPPAPPAAMKTEPPEPSTWSPTPAAPPVPSAEQETAFVRPVRSESDLMPTQIVSPPTAPPPAPPFADEPTQVVPDVAPTQRVAPVWPQPSEPAQLWGAPRERFAQQQSHQQQPPAQPQPAYAARAAQPAAGDGEWDDWEDDGQRRRVSPPPAIGGGGGNRTGSSNNGGGGNGGRRSPKRVLGGVGGVVVVGLVLLLVFTQLGGSGNKPIPAGFHPTASAPADAAKETATAFLTAWQSGDLNKAAGLTDDSAAALSTLTGFQKNLNLAGLQLAPQTSTATTVTPQIAATNSTTGATASATPGPGGTVTFSVEAKVGLPAETASTSSASGASSSSASGASTSSSTGAASGSGTSAAGPTANWTYTSHLTAYEQNGGWWIQWTPGLVAPNLTAATKVVSVAIPAQADEVTDSSGNSLSDAADAGLRNIAAALKKNAPVGGTPGIEVQLQKADGTAVTGTTDKLSEPVNTGELKTTIDAQVETAAMNAVGRYDQSSMVVIRPTTGAILAVANNAGQNDFALTARIAPGSTNKIITSTALMTSGLVSSTSQAVQCPKTITINGTSFGNSAGESLPAGTPFLEDFADSCNNAFTQWYDKIGPTTLAQTAEKYYGLNQPWDIGLGPAGPYYNIPASTSNGELAMELFGQGQLEAAPLAMASVAATVDTGTFRQPIVVPGTAQASATSLPSDVQQALWKMMHAVTQSGGTAAGVYSGVTDEVYGKTGTADVDPDATNAQKPNSWMVVFDPKADLAIACVVLNAGFGASYAGPETASVLKALQ
ncbi:penicillin-binding transpeptidase domain-containing protein [Actinospica robiniae]|uniref:penicillin-binding transpeptidase domain-containing protein n=1 Tax=Actinospica robiniae TaxID=304901 RepID=UPI000418FDEC|nr:penicillin-binding transpeptidase domain-containing protein [Actinospica robiniae]